MRVLISGATGFVGAALLPRMLDHPGRTVVAATRGDVLRPQRDVRYVRVGQLAPDTDWRPVLSGCEAVIHLAARVHVMRERAADPLAEFRRVNVGGTLNFAHQAAASGVRRFVFVSSVKVNGAQSDRPYRESDVPDPDGPYGISKLEAEQGLRVLSTNTGMEVTVIRPPLVYGPGVRGNFRTLMNVVAKGIPLPLRALDNRRSLVAVDNLADFIATCVVHADAGNETFLVSDGEDLSTPELIRRLAQAMDRPARLLAVPPSLITGVAALLGTRAAAQRVCSSLQLDITRARARLGWDPPVGVDEALRRAVAGVR